MAQLDLEGVFPFGLGHRRNTLIQNLDLFEALLRLLERDGKKNTSIFRVLEIETDRVRRGEITLREVHGFEHMIGNLIESYSSELKMGGIPNV
jgi:hypothetical protein